MRGKLLARRGSAATGVSRSVPVGSGLAGSPVFGDVAPRGREPAGRGNRVLVPRDAHLGSPRECGQDPPNSLRYAGPAFSGHHPRDGIAKARAIA